MNQRGNAVVWILIVLALGAAALGSIGLFFTENRIDFVRVFVCGVIVAVLGLAFQLRRDPLEVFTLLPVFGIVAALLYGGAAIYGDDSHPFAAAFAVFCVGLTAYSIGYQRIIGRGLFPSGRTRRSLMRVIRRSIARNDPYRDDEIERWLHELRNRQGDDAKIAAFLRATDTWRTDALVRRAAADRAVRIRWQGLAGVQAAFGVTLPPDLFTRWSIESRLPDGGRRRFLPLDRPSTNFLEEAESIRRQYFADEPVTPELPQPFLPMARGETPLSRIGLWLGQARPDGGFAVLLVPWNGEGEVRVIADSIRDWLRETS